MIVMVAWNDYVHANTALHGVHQFVRHAAIGQKIRCRDVDRFACSRNQCLEKHAGARGSSAGWRAGDYQRRGFARIGCGRREVVPAVKNLPGGLEIVFQEGALNGADSVPLYADHGVAPAWFRLGSIPPPVRISGAAHKGCGSINEGYLTMGAVVNDEPVMQPQPVIPAHRPASFFQRFEITLAGG